jgi:hypothetical protein
VTGPEPWQDLEAWRETRFRRALHEAGHAIIAYWCEIIDVSSASMAQAGEGCWSNVQITSILDHMAHGDDLSEGKARQYRFITIAGSAAEEILLGSPAEKLALGDLATIKRLSPIINQSMDESSELTQYYLHTHWQSLAALAVALFEQDTVAGEDFENVLVNDRLHRGYSPELWCPPVQGPHPIEAQSYFSMGTTDFRICRACGVLAYHARFPRQHLGFREEGQAEWLTLAAEIDVPRWLGE